MSEHIPIGISACLLGEKVRFDGGHKRLAFAVEQLAPYVRFEAICPEMAIGLPTPRPALRLVSSDEGVRMRFSNDEAVDFTDKMQQYSEQRVASLEHLCGYILCAKSPSCGMERVRIYRENSKDNSKIGVGVYTAELQKQLPWLPIEEDGRLNDPLLRENFVERVFALYELKMLHKSGLTRGKLMAFHSRYKLSLLSHSQPEYRELGRFVASMDKWESLEEYFIEYRNRLMSLMKNRATRRNHTNVLMHVQGYFRKQLNSGQRQELAQLIDHYRQGLQPLLAPITLLKHYMHEFPDAYLAQQRYFEPYPEALRLRYGH
ncbi:2-thiouracil desulfurase family protein [Rouxiella sp. T17]|uniref:YbgA family protein n=1 Tax=Rouxiella sp. T17 TaxID=3085684 RepID=UPI002FCB1173